jgi:AraC family transcriptional regulator, regulatory protein of adaptative response / methylated-DNA-[protein]-cysteine methyltransferase
LRKRVSLLDAASEVGLSGTGRLHDLFVSIEGMTPGEFKNGGEQLSINYSFAETPFGNVIIASTPKGICRMTFYQKEDEALTALIQQFPHAQFSQKVDILQQNALFIFQRDWSQLQQIKLHLKGTDFQLKVWQALLKIPMGELQTYGDLATRIEKPGASRALGTAIGNNPVAFLIPCHRVIQSTGAIGGYRWGSTRKTAIIGWEAARMNSRTEAGNA